ncbi:bestrophin-4 [Lepeophtheirus salmonis]|uniref:bestrophin-4 n=1 Tax=Lepeophtheirus salmonis TaxID=72036 RepID=UPI001AE156C2|nr:bestrophin-1-like [Lepeophtheirus salmonis]
MTVSYAAKISTVKVGVFFKLLFTWTGSVYKLIWFEFMAYLVLYFSISILYRFGLGEDGKKIFETLSIFCNTHTTLIPLTFVLAFYVSHVVSRWWDQYKTIPWPDGVAFKVNAYCRGKNKHQNDEIRSIRRNVVRYTCAAIIETLRMVSCKVKKRFPTMNHLVEAGILTDKEVKMIENAHKKTTYLEYSYWVPLYWASELINQAYQKGYIQQSKYVMDIHGELTKIRTECGLILSYDWISFPLVYTQVVTLALNLYFGATLVGRQYLDPNKNLDGVGPDFIFPFFTSFEFFFYNGWCKVAEALLNPFGEDDEDFDTNWMVDRNIQLAYVMVDEIGRNPPDVEKDPYWDVGIPPELPYTVASLDVRGAKQLETGAHKLNVPLDLQETVDPANLPDISFSGNKLQRRISCVMDEVLSWASTPLTDRKCVHGLKRNNSQRSGTSFLSRRRRNSSINNNHLSSFRSVSLKSFDSFVNTPNVSPTSSRKKSIIESRKLSTITTGSGLETVLEGKEISLVNDDIRQNPNIEIIISEPNEN